MEEVSTRLGLLVESLGETFLLAKATGKFKVVDATSKKRKSTKKQTAKAARSPAKKAVMKTNKASPSVKKTNTVKAAASPKKQAPKKEQ